MSLNWDLTKIDGYETLCWMPDPSSDTADPNGDGKVMNPVTHALIWSTISVGIGEITEANAQEFFTRLSMYERVYGPMLTVYNAETDQHEPQFLTPGDVRAHIGLHTNVFPKVTDAAWLKNLMRNYKYDIQRAWERETAATT